MNILDELRHVPENEGGSGMRDHMPLLFLLAFMRCRFGHVVELGVARGRSTDALLSGIYSAPQPRYGLISFDKDEPWTAPHRDPTEWSFNQCDSVVAASMFADKSVALLFVDSSHAFDHTLKELVAWRPKMIPSGIICGHDWHGMYDSKVKEAVAQFLTSYPDYDLQVFPADVGLFVLWPK